MFYFIYIVISITDGCGESFILIEHFNGMIAWPSMKDFVSNARHMDPSKTFNTIPWAMVESV